MRRNRRGFKADEIRSIINRVASCCIAFARCRHIYRNTIRLPSLLSSLAVAIIMTARKDAFIDFIGICYGKVPSLLLRTTVITSSFAALRLKLYDEIFGLASLLTFPKTCDRAERINKADRPYANPSLLHCICYFWLRPFSILRRVRYRV